MDNQTNRTNDFYQDDQHHASGGSQDIKQPEYNKVVVLDDYRQTNETISTKSLYPDHKTISPALSNAFILLDDVIDNLNDAKEFIKDGDLVGSDDMMLHISSTLAELFCCREIGEGFAIIIVSLYHAFQNRDHGAFITIEQINCITKSVKTIRNEPFNSFHKSIDIVMELEDCGLNVTPNHIDNFLEIIGSVNG